MSVNLIEVLKDAVSNNQVDAIGNEMGLDNTAVKSGIDAIVPTVLAGILGKNTLQSATPAWFDAVSGWIGGKNDEMNMPDFNISDIISKGKNTLTELFGSKTEEVTTAVAQKTGIQQEKAGSLLAAVAPLVLGYLTKWMKSKNWTFSNLLSHLTENKADIAAMLPAGLSAAHFMDGSFPKVDLGSTPQVDVGTPTLETARPSVNRTQNVDLGSTPHVGANVPPVEPVPPVFTTAPKEDVRDSNNNWLKWLLWILLLGLILWLILGKGCKSCKNDAVVVNDTTVNVVDTMKAEIDTLSKTIKGKLNEAGDWVYDLGQDIKLKLMDGSELTVGDNSVESRLVKFIEDKDKMVDKTTWFTLDRLYFETGKSTLKAESQQQVKNIAAIMKAYPAVKLKLGGYTDNTGPADLNKKLSQQRADAAMAELVKLGVAKERLEAEGYGPQFPVCEANDTPECRAQNRRIDVRVAAK